MNTTTKAQLKVNGTILEGIPMGSYQLKETSVPEGYTTDETVYTYNYKYKDMNTAVITNNGTVYNQVNKEPFEIIKVSTNSNDTAVLLENVEFTAILKRYVEFYGSYEEALQHTSEYAEDEWCVMKTNAAGYSKSKQLAYGTYVVNETYNPYDGVNIVKEFEVTLSQNSEEPTQHWKVENDTPFVSYIKFIKKDKDTGKVVTYSNATFELYKYNDDTKEWEKIQCKVGKDYYSSWTTDKNGIAYTETKLSYRNI
jgi:hypothetical protein